MAYKSAGFCFKSAAFAVSRLGLDNYKRVVVYNAGARSAVRSRVDDCRCRGLSCVFMAANDAREGGYGNYCNGAFAVAVSEGHKDARCAQGRSGKYKIQIEAKMIFLLTTNLCCDKIKMEQIKSIGRAL